jgi:mRNA-degrading endonuclease toxin of MazEF toxin-antitoxin module
VDPWPAELAARYDAATLRISDCFEARDFLPPETNDRFTLRRLETVADHACACTTDTCRADVRDQLSVLDDDGVSTSPSQTSVDRLLGANRRLARCLGAALAEPMAEALVVIGTLRDQACACADLACVRVPSKAFLDWIATRGRIVDVLLMVEDVVEAAAALNACVKALR